MRRTVFIPAAPASEEDARALVARARPSAQKEASEEGTSLYVSFQLEGVAYALAADCVKEALTRLGPVTRVAVPEVEVGVAFAGNTPILVVDLKALTGSARPLSALMDAPALLLRLDELSIALAVEPPVAFVEGVLAQRAPRGDQEGAHLEGRLDTGALALSGDWLSKWASAHAGADSRG